MWRGSLRAGVGALVLLGAMPAWARVYSLAECVALADARSAQGKMAEDRLEQTRAQLSEVRLSPFSEINVVGGLGPLNEIRGNDTYSPNRDIFLTDRLGFGFLVRLDAFVPLWTFGKLDAKIDAARSAVDLAALDVERVKRQIRHDVRRAYLGVLLVHDGRYLLASAKDRLGEAMEHAGADTDADENEVLRLSTYRQEVIARLSELDRLEHMAMVGLRFLTGLVDDDLLLPDDPLGEPKQPLGALDGYLRAALEGSTEVRSARAKIAQRTAEYELARAKLLPDVGLATNLSYANWPVMADQTNPFVPDYNNHTRFFAGLVLRVNFDQGPGLARMRAAKATLEQAQAALELAEGQVRVATATAWATARDAKSRLQFYGDAEKLAKRWLASVSAGIGVGTREDKELVDPLRTYLLDHYQYLQALMDMDLAFSQLAVATGDESIATF